MKLVGINNIIKNLINGYIRQFNTLFVSEISSWWNANSQNLHLELKRQAIVDTAALIRRDMAGAMYFGDRGSVIQYALDKLDGDGICLEFGVYQGKSINFMANTLPHRNFYGFDSFIGLKEDWAGTYMRAGYFDVGGNLPKVPNNVTLIAGFFQDTLDEFLGTNRERIVLINFDADTYESTLFVLNSIKSRLAANTLVIFDEYMGFHGWQQGEFRAFMEFTQVNSIKYEYLAHSSEQCLVRIL